MEKNQLDSKKGNWFQFCPTYLDWSNPGKDVNLREYVKHLLDTMQKINCDALAYMVDNGGYAIYESKFKPRDPCVGEDDLLQMLIEETHKRKMKFIGGWMSQHCQSYLAKQYPDWTLRDVKGNQIKFFWPELCLNSPAGDYILQDVEEVTRNYPIDAVYVEGNCMPPGYCYCDYCKAIFRETYGYAIPTDEKERESSGTYHRFRMDSVTNFARKLRGALNRESPRTVLMFCVSIYPGYDIESLSRYADMVMTERHGFVRDGHIWEKGMTMQILKSESGKATGSAAAWLSRWGDAYFSHMPSSQLKASFFEDILHGCTPQVHVLNSLDYEDFLIPTLRQVNNHEKILRPYLLHSHRVAYVALLHDYEVVGRESFAEAFKGYYEALMEEHILFEVISKEQIEKGCLRSGKYKVLILPNIVCMSDDLVSDVKDYVNTGGGLVMTFKTSYADGKGKEKGRMSLASLAGITDTFNIVTSPTTSVETETFVKEAMPPNIHYKVVRNHPIRGSLEGKLFAFAGSYVEIECSDDVQVVAEILRWDYSRLNVNRRERRFCPTAYPSAPLIITREGVGRTVYFAGNLDAGYSTRGMRGTRELLGNAVRWAGKKDLLFEVINPPIGLVEFAMYYNQKERTIVILMVNHASNQRFGSPRFPNKRTLVNL